MVAAEDRLTDLLFHEASSRSAVKLGAGLALSHLHLHFLIPLFFSSAAEHCSVNKDCEPQEAPASQGAPREEGPIVSDRTAC